MANEKVNLPDNEGRRSRGLRFLWKTSDVDVSKEQDTADKKTADKDKGEDKDKNEKT